LWWLRPDGKTQVTIEYKQHGDGSVEPMKFHTVVISTQHAEPLKATRQKEVAGYSGSDETAPSMEEMNKLIVERVVKKTLEEITLKNGQRGSRSSVISRIFTLIPRVSSSSVARKGMLASLGAKSSSTPTVVGVLMGAAPSRVKTQPRWIDLQPTFAGRWPNQL